LRDFNPGSAWGHSRRRRPRQSVHALPLLPQKLTQTHRHGFRRLVPTTVVSRCSDVRRVRLVQHSLPDGLLGLTWAGLAPADRASFAWRLRSFNDLVGAREQRCGYVEAERFGGLEIDDEFETR
jgi:hypothetical protein